jgi:MbtH protein
MEKIRTAFRDESFSTFMSISLTGVNMSLQAQSIENSYEVVINEEGQYSIWPSGKAIPHGWNVAGKNGDKDACLQYIKEVWTDMRPNSLQQEMSLTKH